MKTSEVKDLRSKNLEELKVLLKEAKAELIKLRLDLASKKLKNTRKLFFQRKKISLLLTLIGEKGVVNA